MRKTEAAGSPKVQTNAKSCGHMMTAAKAPLPEGPRVRAVRIPVPMLSAWIAKLEKIVRRMALPAPFPLKKPEMGCFKFKIRSPRGCDLTVEQAQYKVHACP